MSDPVGVALIGTGMWGRRLAEALRRTHALRLVTCYSRDAGRRQAFAESLGCLAADSLEAAIENDGVQAVLLVTPNHAHADAATACAQRGRHLFVEKPIADTLEDGRRIEAACRQAGVVLQVGHCFRRLGAARRVKELLEEGALGEVLLAEAHFSLPARLTPDTWRYYRSTCPGGPLMQLGIHHADTLQYWLGPIRRVSGSFAHVVTPAEIDDVGIAMIEFESGARGVIDGNYLSPKTYALRLFGAKAVLEYVTDMTIWPAAERMDPATVLRLRAADGEERMEFAPRDMVVDELEEFARSVRGEATPETGAAEAMAALAVIRAAIASHEMGAPVTVAELTVPREGLASSEGQ